MPKIYITESDGIKPMHYSTQETIDMFGEEFLEEYGTDISAYDAARLLDMQETQKRYWKLLRELKPDL